MTASAGSLRSLFCRGLSHRHSPVFNCLLDGEAYGCLAMLMQLVQNGSVFSICLGVGGDC